MWKVLPQVQRTGIRNFIVDLVLKHAKHRDLVLAKLNVCLVAILKQDWPHNWPGFIPEIIQASQQDLDLCENNMHILKLLSEEIFDYSLQQMTLAKTRKLKNHMCQEFSDIFSLCHQVLEQAQKPSLILATLHTLLRFLNWIPLGYIFETNLIELLCVRFFSVPLFQNVVLKCCYEIAALQVGAEYDAKFVQLYTGVIKGFVPLVSLTLDFDSTYENSSDQMQNYMQNIALFLAQFYSAHLRVLEQAAVQDPQVGVLLITGHEYLLKISQIKDREVFKIALEYWTRLVAELYDESAGLKGMQGGNEQLRKHGYATILSNLRTVMIEAMARPEEVLIVENDEGEIVRETLKESDTIVLYKSMREVLVYLTHLDPEDTERVMTGKLEKQVFHN